MVSSKEKMISALTRLRLGTAMLWLGVLVWAPFILLRASGYRPSLLWFLPFHLLGVVGGSRLRTSARKELGVFPEKKNFFRTAGHVLIILGILAWAPYIYQKTTAQTPLDVTTVLPFHLTGVIGGATLLTIGAIVRRREE